MKTITINSFELHIAETFYEWRKEIKERIVEGFDTHHIAGRYGILRYMVENILIEPHGIHIYEKSLDEKKRKIHRDYVRMHIPKKLLLTLYSIRDKYKYRDPTGKRYIELMEKE